MRCRTAPAPDAAPGRPHRPDDALAGWFAGPPALCDGDPFATPWMEAGPDRLAVLRGGRTVHQGRHALTRPDTAGPRMTKTAGADGTMGLAVVQERQCTPAQAEDLLAKVVTRAQEYGRNHPRP